MNKVFEPWIETCRMGVARLTTTEASSLDQIMASVDETAKAENLTIDLKTAMFILMMMQRLLIENGFPSPDADPTTCAKGLMLIHGALSVGFVARYSDEPESE